MDLIEISELHKKLRQTHCLNPVRIVTAKQLQREGTFTGQVETPSVPAVLDYINLLMKPEEVRHG